MQNYYKFLHFAMIFCETFYFYTKLNTRNKKKEKKKTNKENYNYLIKKNIKL